MNSFGISADELGHSWAWAPLLIDQYRGSDLTLVTTGCSFTWGDDLGGTHHAKSIDNREFRESHIFGKLLSDKLNSNWVQSALPAGSNEWMLYEIKKVFDKIHNKTKQIICVISWTDIGRELNRYHHPNPEFPPINTPIHNIWQTGTAQGLSINKIIQQVEDHQYQFVADLEKEYPNVKILCGYAFSDPVASQRNNQLDKTWLNVCLEFQNLPIPTSNTQTAGLATECITSYINQLKNNSQYKLELVDDIIPRSLDRIDVLASSDIHSKRTRAHPNPLGHELWAEYLYNYIKKSL